MLKDRETEREGERESQVGWVCGNAAGMGLAM